MNNKFKRIISLLLAMVMMMSVPMFAMAEELSEENSISLFSLFPIEEVRATIDLTTYTVDELMNLPTSSLVANLKDSYTGEPIVVEDATATVWCNFLDEDGNYVYDTWKVLGMDETVDVLSLYMELGWYGDCEIIIGSGNQLDDTNQRFFVDFELPESSAEIDLTGYRYPELYSICAGDLLLNMTVNDEPFEIADESTVGILWNVRELKDAGITFLSGHSDSNSHSSDWEKLDLLEYVKFAPETADREMMDIYLWENQTMLIKADGETALYNINVIYPEWNDLFEFNLYCQGENDERTKINIDDFYEYDTRYFSESRDEYAHVLAINAEVNSSYSRTEDYYFGLKLNEAFAETTKVWLIDGWGYEKENLLKFLKDNYMGDENPDNGASSGNGTGVGGGGGNVNFGEHDVTDEFMVDDMTVADAGVKAKWMDWTDEGRLTLLVLDTEYGILECEFIRLDFQHNTHGVSLDWGIYTDVDGDRVEISAGGHSNYTEEKVDDYWYYTQEATFYLEEGNPTNADYSISFKFYDGDAHEWSYDCSKVKKAVVGHFYTLEEAANEEDIKDQLFVENMWTVGAGYKDNFSDEGIDFTFFVGDEVIHHRVKIAETEVVEEDGAPNVGSSDRYFQVNALYNGNKALDTYVVPYEHDTYYSYGYQTLLINDTEADMTAVAPEVYLGYHAKVYYNGTLEETDNASYYNKLNARDFTGTPADATRDPENSIKYTVSAENHIDQKNYWITAVKKEEGPKLFVNGPDEREIFLNNYFDNAHDIFVANIGTEELTGIMVTLDATNVKLDDYWTLGGEGNNTLAPFTTNENETGNNNGELFNVAKIRLLPAGEGEITGTLTITADGQEPRVITLTGTAGNPKIDTSSLHDAVKYVPYSAIVTTNNMHDWNKVTLELEDGELPEGVEFYPSGEIYGVPKETGEFPITIRARYSHGAFDDSYANLVLKVQDNTDENVNATVDEGYAITIRVPDTITSYTDREFEIEGVLAEFVDFWLDGEKLVKDVDYTAEEGSTKITIKSQTFSNAGNGKHTISAEFRVDGDRNKDLKKASQNYTKSSGGGYSGGGGGGTASYKVTFETNGGSAIDAKTIKKGNTITDLPTPIKDGFVFAGWYKDAALTQAFDSTTKITAKTTLYAKWDALHQVTFETNGGTAVEAMSVQNGKTIAQLPPSTKENYTLAGWYKDAELTQVYDVNEAVTAAMTLYAKWNVVIPDEAPADASGFVDVTKDDWFYEDVQWAYSNKYMVGYNNAQFAPNDAITGGMVVAVLARLADVDVSEYEDTQFEDVYEGQWYTPYAKWAKAVGLVDGIPFNPPAEISREWMGIVLDRYLDYVEAEYEITEDVVEFADSDLISDEAMEAMQTLFKLEIFRGKGNNIIDPVSNTTRAEFAALIHRVTIFLTK